VKEREASSGDVNVLQIKRKQSKAICGGRGLLSYDLDDGIEAHAHLRVLSQDDILGHQLALLLAQVIQHTFDGLQHFQHFGGESMVVPFLRGQSGFQRGSQWPYIPARQHYSPDSLRR